MSVNMEQRLTKIEQELRQLQGAQKKMFERVEALEKASEQLRTDGSELRDTVDQMQNALGDV